MTTFWSLYITALTLGTLLALTWLIFATRKGQRSSTTDETVGHSYDGIEEYDNPLPKWWFMLFVGTLVFAVGYLALYPGLGTWKGLMPGYQSADEFADKEKGWTGVHQWEKEMAKADEKYGPIFAKFAAMPIEEVAKDPQAVKWAVAARLQLLDLPRLRRQGRLRLPQPRPTPTGAGAASRKPSRPPSWLAATPPCRPGVK